MSQRDAVEWRKSAEPSRDWIMIELKKWRRWIAGCCQWMLFILFRFPHTSSLRLRFRAIMHRAYCWVRLKLFIMMEKGYTTTQHRMTHLPSLPSLFQLPLICSSYLSSSSRLCVVTHLSPPKGTQHHLSPWPTRMVGEHVEGGGEPLYPSLSLLSFGKDLYLLYECDTTELTELALF